jgi:hypothetical protein
VKPGRKYVHAALRQENNGAMGRTAARADGMPLAARWALSGAAIACGVGAIAGLIVGLFVYPPTALFAGVEVAIPATLVGGLLGAAAGGIAAAARRARNRSPAG